MKKENSEQFNKENKTSAKKLSKKAKTVIAFTAVLVVAVSAVITISSLSVHKPEVLSFYAKNQQYEKTFTEYKTAILDENGNSMMYNPANASLALADENGKIICSSASEGASKSLKAALLTVEARNKKGDSLSFNSTDNSVLFKTFECKDEKNKLTVIFTFFKNVESAKGGFDEKGECFTIPLVISLDGGKISASVNCADIVTSKNLYIEKISILPGLFSVVLSENNESYIVPDGSGALVSLNLSENEELSLDLPVYGNDISYSGQKAGAYLPCFQFSGGQGTVSAFISGGDGLSSIRCDRSSTFGNLYNTFTVTPVSFDGLRVNKGISYSGEIALKFYVSKSNDDDVVALSAIAKEELINKEYLSDEPLEVLGDYKFFIDLIGSENAKTTALTSFEDAREITAFLYTKGVRGSYIRFSGALSGGLNQKPIKENGVSSLLGGENGLKKLLETAEKNGASVWLDSNIFASDKALKTLSGSDLKADFYTGLREEIKAEKFESKLGGTESIDKNVSSLYFLTSSFDSLGISLNDASRFLYSDSEDELTRQDMISKLQKSAASVSSDNGCMLSLPTVYLMRNASAVFEVPLSAESAAVGGVENVPLLQMVLHGSVLYGCKPINTSDGNHWQEVLKAVEYGACPTFLFTYGDCENLSYGIHASTIAKYYTNLKSLKSIQDMKITSHEKVGEGVYKTIYNYKRVVYVNFNSSVMMADGVLIAPQSFVLI